MGESLRTRSVRTLAWLGDAHFEVLVRTRICSLGDWPVDRLDRVRARCSRAEAQARMLAQIEAELDEDESAVVGRARNQKLRAGGRAQRDVKSYRAATALEALVAWWQQSAEGRERCEALLGPILDAAIEAAFSASARPKRG